MPLLRQLTTLVALSAAVQVTLADVVARRILGTSGLYTPEDKESIAAAQ